MPAEILAIGTTAANSADQVVTAGTPLTVALKPASGADLSGALVNIMLKDDGGAYNRVDTLSEVKPGVVINGGGTYRFARVAGTACGVFSG